MPDSEGRLPHDKDSLNGRHYTSRETSCRCLARLSDGAVHTLTRLIVSWPRRGAGVFCSLLALFRQWGENDNEANVVIYQRSGWIWSKLYLSVNHILFQPTVTCTWRCPINHFLSEWFISLPHVEYVWFCNFCILRVSSYLQPLYVPEWWSNLFLLFIFNNVFIIQCLSESRFFSLLQNIDSLNQLIIFLLFLYVFLY